MTNSFSLDDIRSAAEKQYGATEFTAGETVVATLINPLRLPKAKRDELYALVDSAGGEDVDVDKLFEDVIRVAAKSNSEADKLIKAAGGDLAVLKEIFERYTKGSQVGEA